MFCKMHPVSKYLYYPIFISSTAANEILKGTNNWGPIKKNFLWIICNAVLFQGLVGITWKLQLLIGK